MLPISRGRVATPDRILVYGRPGVGKSTFASGADRPLFLDIEKGSMKIDVSRCHPESYDEFIHTLKNWPVEFRTCVVDTIDALERLIFGSICRELAVDCIEAIGYGKGYNKAVDRWNEVLSELDVLRTRHGVEVILLSHSVVRNVTNPSGTDYTRHELGIHAKSVGTLTAWVDSLAYADIEHTVTKAEKIITTGRRVLRLAPGAWDAKCRFRNAPDVIENSYAAYSAMRNSFNITETKAAPAVVLPETKAAEAVAASAEDVFAECEGLLKKVPDPETQKIIGPFIEANKTNLATLVKTRSRLLQLTEGV